MSLNDFLWVAGSLGTAWVLGFKAGATWKKFRDALNSASSTN